MDNSVSIISLLNTFCRQQPLLLCLLMFIFGSCVGSFLNVLALRSLKEESIVFPSSYCPECKHPLSALDNIPIISFFLLCGKCRYCRKPISFQYPLVEFATGLTWALLAFIFLAQPIPVADFQPGHDLFSAIQQGLLAQENLRQEAIRQGRTLASAFSGLQTLDQDNFLLYKFGLFTGMLVFASTLIAVTVTDLREKLIPHEITYPSMLFGIAFSAIIRADLMGAMAGIGASYIIFDFLAFYGLKLYMMAHRKDGEEICAAAPAEGEQGSLSEAEAEPVEVMGGGDAVLSAVMSAYLGWQALVLALIIGFLAGTAMGLVLLVLEMKKAGLLIECRRKSLKWGLICGLTFAVVMGALPMAFSAPEDFINNAGRPFLYGAITGGISGALIGLVRVGSRVSKPFPFGPALALGGFIAMFLIPYWLPFYSGFYQVHSPF